MGKLKTRKPTGQAPYPFILVEGKAKSGKGWSWATLSSSERVGRTVAIITGERDGDEYAAIPGADYEVAVHDGTYRQIRTQIEAACSELGADEQGRPPVIIVDSATNLWTMLKNEAQQKAFRRAVKNARKYNNPVPSDAEEASIHMDLWNWAKTRWRRLIDPLMQFDGICVVTARGKEIAEVEGQPTGNTRWKVDAEKSLVYDVDVWVRTLAPRKALLVGARSVKRGIDPGSQRKLSADWSLEHIIFDMLECGDGDVDYVPMQPDPDDGGQRQTQDWSGNSDWKKVNKRLHALIAECGLNGHTSKRVRRALKTKRGVDSYKHLPPEYLQAVADKLQALSPAEQDDGSMSPRMSRILSVTGMSPDAATKSKDETHGGPGETKDDSGPSQPPVMRLMEIAREAVDDDVLHRYMKTLCDQYDVKSLNDAPEHSLEGQCEILEGHSVETRRKYIEHRIDPDAYASNKQAS